MWKSLKGTLRRVWFNHPVICVFVSVLLLDDSLYYTCVQVNGSIVMKNMPVNVIFCIWLPKYAQRQSADQNVQLTIFIFFFVFNMLRLSWFVFRVEYGIIVIWTIFCIHSFMKATCRVYLLENRWNFVRTDKWSDKITLNFKWRMDYIQ